MQTITQPKDLFTIVRRMGLIVLMVFSVPSHGQSTQIHFTFQNEQGIRIHIDSAELLLTGWGISERFPLSHTNEALTVVLEKEWLKQYWTYRIVDLSEARILVYASGYAPQLSDPFPWIHDADHLPHFSPNVQTLLSFTGNEGRMIQEGQNITFPLIFYLPQPRTIVLIDDLGSPLPNIRVAIYLFWSHENHCGVMYEDFPVGTFMTDMSGRFTIPEAGKGTYFLDIQSDDAMYCLKGAKRHDAYCAQTTLQLDDPETVIALHSLQQITFDFVLKRPESLQGEDLGLYEQIETPCGFGGGRVGIFSASEKLSVQCYPEQIEQMWIGKGQQENPPSPEKWIVNIEGIQHGQTYLIDLRGVEPGEHVTPQILPHPQ